MSGVAFLDDEWVARLVGTALPGVDGTIAFTVAGTPARDVTVRLVVSDGNVEEAASGPGAGDAAAAFTIGADDASAILDGTLDPSVAYMQGRLKTAGDNGLVLTVLAATATDAWRADRAELAAMTDG